MNQVVLITGATGTIASATAHALARKGCQLVLLARSAEKLQHLERQLVQENPGARVHLYQADFSDLHEVQKVALEVGQQHQKIHALLHTAAVFKQQLSLTPEGMETMFAVNHMAPFVLTKALFETLQNTPESRVLTVTAPSTTPLNWSDLMGTQRFNALSAFGATKMANLLFAFKLARAGMVSHALHPGLVRSDLLREAPPMVRLVGGLVAGNADKVGQAFCEIATSHRYLQSNGQFYHLTRSIQPAAYARSPENQDQLWDASLKWLNTVEASVRG